MGENAERVLRLQSQSHGARSIRNMRAWEASNISGGEGVYSKGAVALHWLSHQRRALNSWADKTTEVHSSLPPMVLTPRVSKEAERFQCEEQERMGKFAGIRSRLLLIVITLLQAQYISLRLSSRKSSNSRSLNISASRLHTSSGQHSCWLILEPGVSF